MQFNSWTFLIFFALVLALHHMPWSWSVKKLNLLWASYLFYAAWNPPFVILLWISTVIDWYTARGLYASTSPGRRRMFLLITMCSNLGMLGFFKYGNFLLENFTWVLGQMGIAFHPLPMDILLPAGISFYTFQTMSYTLDVYMKRAAPATSFLDYALYVTFFPQLVAGPIVRADYFLPQCLKPRRTTASQFGWGLTLLILGIFEKSVLADALFAPLAERVYTAGTDVTLGSAWGGTLAFAGQIFCDFAGYSTSAIGAAMCLGFDLPVNFRFPYAAIGFSDFWTRWHISLSSWLRDYLYIPLGGNRRGKPRTYINVMATVLLGGLWHGASWTFVVWGGLHGSYLVVERALRQRIGNWPLWKSQYVRPLLALVTFLLVCFTWVFFRARTFDQAFRFCGSMLGIAPALANAPLNAQELATLLLATLGLLAVHWKLRDKTLEDVACRLAWPVRSMGLAILLIAILTSPGDDRAFIYFQF